VRDPALLLIVDDNRDNRDILEARLTSRGYATATAVDGEEAVAKAAALLPDLILLDVMMPKLDGLEVTRRLRADPTLPFIPIVLVTAKAAVKDVVAGLEAGADDYLTKPVEQAALVARVRSMLRIKALHDEVQAQKAELAAWNRTLERRVAAQVAEIRRMSRLKRFLAPQLAELVVSGGQDQLLESHRREVTVVFCDLRGFTAFADTTAPEAVMAVLGEYHQALGALVHRHEGTLERFLGDGVVVVFNDPLPCPEPERRAVRMAVAMRERIGSLSREWRARGHALGFGVGIAHGPATLGRIGFEGREDYAAIGTVANLAARLCDAAADGEILLDSRALAGLAGDTRTEPAGELALKGFARPVAAWRVLGLAEEGVNQTTSARRPLSPACGGEAG
jgi:class 3 adenylate cyclase/CheY-like chemotaxis protein